MTLHCLLSQPSLVLLKADQSITLLGAISTKQDRALKVKQEELAEQHARNFWLAHDSSALLDANARAVANAHAEFDLSNVLLDDLADSADEIAKLKAEIARLKAANERLQAPKRKRTPNPRYM